MYLYVNTLEPGDYDTENYDLLVIMSWHLCGKYSPLAAVSICPVITIFYINFDSDYNLKMSKWLTFLYPFLPLS